MILIRWGQTAAGGIACAREGSTSGAIVGTGALVEKKEQEAMEHDVDQKEGMKPEDKGEDEGENPDCMSGIERGVSCLELYFGVQTPIKSLCCGKCPSRSMAIVADITKAEIFTSHYKANAIRMPMRRIIPSAY